MMTMLIAAAVAAQPAPPANPHGQMTPAQHQQHKDCCKDCCKDMADKHNGQGTERGGHGAHAGA
jgi:hypothetical protein